MVGDKKWEGGRKIMRNPCLSCLLNNTDKHEHIRSRMKFNFARWKMEIKIARWIIDRRKKFHQIYPFISFFFPFLSQFSTYTFRLKFNNICENIKSADLNLSPLDGIVRNNYRRASLFSFHCFQATISYSNKFTQKKKEKKSIGSNFVDQ